MKRWPCHVEYILVTETAILRMTPPQAVNFTALCIEDHGSLTCVLPKAVHFEAAKAVMEEANSNDAELYLEDLTLSHSLLASRRPTDATPWSCGSLYVGIVENTSLSNMCIAETMPIEELLGEHGWKASHDRQQNS